MGRIGRDLLLQWFLIVVFTTLNRVNSDPALCQLSFDSGYKLFNFSLATPLPKFPHGILSEDGFYKVQGNETVLWFQLCDGMIFNHDPPRCVGCMGCGGPSRCGMECSALVSNNNGGYDVCTTLGHVSSTKIDVIDRENPHKGVIVKMSGSSSKYNCSLSISVICDANGVKGPLVLEKLDRCNYATVLRHPSGCATVTTVHGSGWAWFGTLIAIIACLFIAYLLVGAFYRFFALGVRGIDVIPNLDLWMSLPHKIQNCFVSLVRRFKGPSHGYRNYSSPVNF
ncbi:uncharacterized protein LOC110819184 [Carica papaya]|uniref:uncharacterized protein LOC110819184 n=1 Tax=Carica papaya TaxID=3649 RepID=UPI000B8CB175|nr:uncharacterized protein LOC110819184 [Carica papaya]